MPTAAPSGWPEQLEQIELRLTRAGIVCNLVGAVTVFVFLVYLLPVSVDGDQFEHLLPRNTVAFVLYMGLTLPLGRRYMRRRYFAPLREWVLSGRPATEAEQRLVLGYPRHMALVAVFFWVGASVVFSLLNIDAPRELVISVAAAPLTGCLAAASLLYLIAERIMRPVTALALEGSPPRERTLPSVVSRLTMAWVVGTAVPLLGAAAIAIVDLAGADFDATLTLASILFLLAAAGSVGLLVTVMAARSIAEPLGSVRQGIEQVERGAFDVRVPVDDGSEVGLLQSGFNRMAAGLEERERLRDLFGRHVGHDVARAALEHPPELGGEARDIAVLFVDLIGSTGMASRRPPAEVVAYLNRFFAVVVAAIERNGGSVNKFEGDGALCVFGAPVPLADPAGAALAAGRELCAELARQEGMDAGIGISAGQAVAGNVGAEQRFEYTVIGDPVNEAARLCELAKRRPERLLASEAALTRAGDGESARWQLGDEVELRGRAEPTRLAVTQAAVGRLASPAAGTK